MRDLKNILLVEDDDIDAFILNAMLKRNCVNCIIKRVHNGREALEYVQSHVDDQPDLILLDLNMPVMGGKAFLEEVLHEQHLQDLKVAVLTSSGNPQDKQECVDLGASEYFEKPMNDLFTKRLMTMIDAQSAVS